MEMTTLIIVGVIVLIAIITIIGILSRYRKCKSDELLVVYGKTGSHKEKVNELDAKGNQVSREVEIKTARVYHGGAAFVWPIIQGYEVMSMRPIQLNLTLKDALSAQNIRVTVPTTVTVAISQDPLIMQNAANRLLGVDDTDKESLISDIVYGQMRLIVASMEIEELNSNRDKFLTQARDNINTELNKLGLYLININISDIRETTKARAQAEAAIAEEEKKGAIQIALTTKERETKVAEANKQAGVAEHMATIEVSKAKGEAAKAAADADKVAGISKVDAETTIARTEQEKIAEIKEAEAKAKEAELNATVIVPANKAKEKAIIDAEAVKQEAILKAEAKAAEILKEAEAKANATQMQLEAVK